MIVAVLLLIMFVLMVWALVRAAYYKVRWDDEAESRNMTEHQLRLLRADHERCHHQRLITTGVTLNEVNT